MTRNEIIAENIARGIFCGDCEKDDMDECSERGCVQIREQVVAALDAKDREFRKRVK